MRNNHTLSAAKMQLIGFEGSNTRYTINVFLNSGCIIYGINKGDTVLGVPLPLLKKKKIMELTFGRV